MTNSRAWTGILGATLGGLLNFRLLDDADETFDRVADDIRDAILRITSSASSLSSASSDAASSSVGGGGAGLTLPVLPADLAFAMQLQLRFEAEARADAISSSFPSSVAAATSPPSAPSCASLQEPLDLSSPAAVVSHLRQGLSDMRAGNSSSEALLVRVLEALNGLIVSRDDPTHAANREALGLLGACEDVVETMASASSSSGSGIAHI